MSTETIDEDLGVIEIESETKGEVINMGKEITVPHETSTPDIEADYVYQRKNFYDLVEKGSTAIDGILELAKEGEHPRGYDQANQYASEGGGEGSRQKAEQKEHSGAVQAETLPALANGRAGAGKRVFHVQKGSAHCGPRSRAD